ncbi:CBS domain-containing protein [Spiribacter halobius]|uniref:Histidine kinase n=1 Tax=Sediminicurvatus halobius TaxID=2182432 RepID=A0A2U2N4I8_9GAMM|nr:CBS domain-containing protein [Spiribacter halobius]PWG63879.1 histidine kinase [Spiribacter halobius]UEX76286.1 CBS domain-containing protein [Spiribacter halobius]
MLVKDIMKTDVVTISPLASLREAMQLMRSRDVKSLVVEKRGPHDAYGLVTYTTILRTIVAEEGDIDLINVYDVCSKPAISVHPELDVRHVARLMVNQSFRRVLVLRDNELAGILTRNDIVASVLEMAED